jgi:hypothetical protein
MTIAFDRISGALTLLFALTTLVTIAVGYAQPPEPVAPTDEGTLAHIFQIALALFVPSFLLFVTTADWTRPRFGARVVAVSLLAVGFALVGLWMGEPGIWYPAAG